MTSRPETDTTGFVAPCAETLYGPRTSTFCNPLRHNAMQNNLVRGPLKKVGTTNIIICISIRYKFDLFVVRSLVLLLQILRCAQGADTFVENCRFMRRGVSPAASLRTGSISKAAVSDGLRNRFICLWASRMGD